MLSALLSEREFKPCFYVAEEKSSAQEPKERGGAWRKLSTMWNKTHKERGKQATTVESLQRFLKLIVVQIHRNTKCAVPSYL